MERFEVTVRFQVDADHVSDAQMVGLVVTQMVADNFTFPADGKESIFVAPVRHARCDCPSRIHCEASERHPACEACPKCWSAIPATCVGSR
jgi:hypothetical protein